MPIVRIDIESGKSPAYRHAVLAGVRRGVTSGLGVADDRVTVRLCEIAGDNIDTAGAKSDRYTVVEVSMLPGRDAALKDAMYRAIAEELAAEPGISARDLVVLVHDPSAECFFLNGEIACGPTQSMTSVPEEDS